jgi:hypothetical protein
VAHDRVLAEDAVRAVHVAGHARDLQRDVDVVHLRQADLLVRQLALVLQDAEAPREELALGDLAQHPRELVLDELEARDRAVELDPRLARTRWPSQAALRRAERAPRDAVPRVGEAASGPLRPLTPGSMFVLRELHVLEHELRGDGRAQAVFARHLRAR